MQHQRRTSAVDANAEPTLADIEREFPMWRIWVGVDRLCHALRTRGAALTARGEDWMALRDQIRAAESMLRESRPAGWPDQLPRAN